MLLFVLQKPLFMLYNLSIDGSIRWSDYVAVMWHGLALDATVTGYILIVPWAVLLISLFVPSLNLLKMLRPYFCIVSLLLAIVFIVDTSLYNFWHFKLDGSVFIYTDKPSNALASVSIGYILLRLLCIILFSVFYAWLYIVVFSSTNRGGATVDSTGVSMWP